jgi:hypothetical protein
VFRFPAWTAAKIAFASLYEASDDMTVYFVAFDEATAQIYQDIRAVSDYAE